MGMCESGKTKFLAGKSERKASSGREDKHIGHSVERKTRASGLDN